MGFDKVMALYWDFWLIPYYKVYVKSGKKVVKIFNQKVINSEKGSTIALIDKKNKLGWWINENSLEHKARIMFIVDIKNAIPLKIEEISEFSSSSILGDLITIQKITKKISIDDKKQKIEKKTGNTEKFVEVLFPPSLFFRVINAHMVEETMSDPPSKWKELAPVLIIIVIVAGLLLWYLMSSGGLKGIGA